MRIVKNIKLLSLVYNSLINYPSPNNLSYFWNFGIYSLACFGVQIITGIFLAMHYVSEVHLAFLSVEHIMRDVSYGWLLRYMHANGASMFFIVVYIHMFRGLYYNSFVYPRQLLWGIGVIILLLMIIIAFIGYVLPWGQMSFWGATVITNLASAIPYIGSDIVVWLWGGYSVDNATLNRFFSLHYLLPFILAGLIGLHLVFLHESLSTNPLGIFFIIDKIPLYPYYFLKDLFGVLLFFVFFSIFLFFMPNLLGHPDNYIPANPMATPAHIVPEWYFLPFYAILRSIPDKLAGVCALLFSIISLYLLPFIIKPEIRNISFHPITKYLFWYILLDSVILGWLGSKPVKYPFIQMGQLATIFYFMYLLVILPLVTRIENLSWSNDLYIREKMRAFILKTGKLYHRYHIVTPSPWPLLTSISAFNVTIGGVLYMHRYLNSFFILSFGIISLVIMMFMWWRDVIREATFEGMHTNEVQKGLKLGVILFITTEVMFFFGFFWSYFNYSMDPSIAIGGIWPPYGLEVFDPYGIPLLNTFILLLSGATVTVCHYFIILRDAFKAAWFLIATLCCAILFLLMQAYEYFVASFDISDGVFGSIFFMATGFHGFHVFIGTVFLSVCYIRMERYHFTQNHHIGFLAAAWYWHFVDVVWLFLFVVVYWLPSVV